MRLGQVLGSLQMVTLVGGLLGLMLVLLERATGDQFSAIR